jgi:hypothetical protein
VSAARSHIGSWLVVVKGELLVAHQSNGAGVRDGMRSETQEQNLLRNNGSRKC